MEKKQNLTHNNSLEKKCILCLVVFYVTHASDTEYNGNSINPCRILSRESAKSSVTNTLTAGLFTHPMSRAFSLVFSSGIPDYRVASLLFSSTRFFLAFVTFETCRKFALGPPATNNNLRNHILFISSDCALWLFGSFNNFVHIICRH